MEIQVGKAMLKVGGDVVEVKKKMIRGVARIKFISVRAGVSKPEFTRSLVLEFNRR